MNIQDQKINDIIQKIEDKKGDIRNIESKYGSSNNSDYKEKPYSMTVKTSKFGVHQP